MTAVDGVALNMRGMAEIFEPESVAVLGASSHPTKIGGRPITFLKENGFEGAIYPINPSYDEIQGLRAYRSLDDVPGDVTVAIIALPKDHILDAMRACSRKGVTAVVVFSAGFAEVGAEGREDEKELIEIAESAGIRILGPNCIGAMSRKTGASLTFAAAAAADPNERRTAGRVAFATQSGALAVHCVVAGLDRGLEFDPWISTGNEADLDVADAIGYFAVDPDVDAIAVYIEGCRDGDKLRTALRSARRNRKPVFMVKVGLSESGARAAMSHTGALTGSDAIFDAVCRENNVCRVADIEELLDTAYAFTVGGLPSVEPTAVITSSGGVGIMMADAAADADVKLPAPGEALQSALREIWSPAGVNNPIDTTAQAMNDANLLPRFLDALTRSGEYGSVVGFFTYMGLFSPWREDFIDAMKAVRERHGNLALFMSVLTTPEIRAELEDIRIPVFRDPSAAMHVMGRLILLERGFKESTPDDPPYGLRRGYRGNGGELHALSEIDSARLLESADVRTPPGTVARSAQEAADYVNSVQGEVVMKILSADIPHKSDVGGVETGIVDATGARDAYDRICAAAARHCPDATIDGVLVSRSETGGIEVLVGTTVDPVFGPSVVFGMGGLHAELYADTSLRLAPVTTETALDMIRETRAAALLEGYRGAAGYDTVALAELISAVSELAASRSDVIDSIDINPVLVRPAGEGVVALDSLVIERRAGGSPTRL